jgi:hypothetical protein
MPEGTAIASPCYQLRPGDLGSPGLKRDMGDSPYPVVVSPRIAVKKETPPRVPIFATVSVFG